MPDPVPKIDPQPVPVPAWVWTALADVFTESNPTFDRAGFLAYAARQEGHMEENND